MSNKAFATLTIIFISWISIWMISYDNIWLKIPIVADMFPLPLPNGNLSYSDFVTSVGIIGTLFLILEMSHYAGTVSKVKKGFNH